MGSLWELAALPFTAAAGEVLPAPLALLVGEYARNLKQCGALLECALRALERNRAPGWSASMIPCPSDTLGGRFVLCGTGFEPVPDVCVASFLAYPEFGELMRGLMRGVDRGVRVSRHRRLTISLEQDREKETLTFAAPNGLMLTEIADAIAGSQLQKAWSTSYTCEVRSDDGEHMGVLVELASRWQPSGSMNDKGRLNAIQLRLFQ